MAGMVAAAGDCDDAVSMINPLATDVYGDGTDQNCDGVDANYVGVGRYIFQDSLPSISRVVLRIFKTVELIVTSSKNMGKR